MLVKLDNDTITPELQRLIREVKRPVVLFQAGAKAVQKGISSHLKLLQARGNAKGWPEQHFFSGGPTSVERNVGIARVDGQGAEVTIADPRFIHRINGGTVTPKRCKFLRIPLRAEAYAMSGKGSLRESMPGLKVWKFKKGLFLVKEVEERASTGERTAKGNKRYRKTKRIRVLPMFKLVRSVRHNPHPDEMPDSAKLGKQAREAMEKAANILLAAGKKGYSD